MPSARERDASATPDARLDPRVAAAHQRHWRSNVRLTLVLLTLWAVAGLGCGVLFADALNELTLLGMPVGFWFAQQGSIATFVVLILVYAFGMARLDRRLDRELAALAATDEGESA